jgi:hypothetical protein
MMSIVICFNILGLQLISWALTINMEIILVWWFVIVPNFLSIFTFGKCNFSFKIKEEQTKKLLE